MITFHFVEQGSQQWHDDREDCYTGSNAHKLFSTMNVQEYAKAGDSSFGGNFHTKRGHLLEDEAIELYEQIKHTKIMRNDEGIKVGYIKNTKFDKCLYSPDGVDETPLLEVKCFAVNNHLKLISGDIDHKILAQIYYGLTISERPYAYLIPYNPSKELATKDQFKMIRIDMSRSIRSNFTKLLKSVTVAA